MHKGKKIVRPPYLKAGDKIALVSPAYWVPEEAILQAADAIRGWGFQPVVGSHTTSLNMDAYAGTADERVADLMWAIEDDSIKAIICSRGGYGSIHLLGRIPLEELLAHPKWIIGHGDITTLLYIAASLGIASIHGPMAFQIASAQESTKSMIRNLLMGILPQYHIPYNQYNHCGHAEGMLVGGNLSTYATISGTIYQLSPDQDIILYLEEVEESLHAIDRLFYMLCLQKEFQNVKGIILGSFRSIKYDLQFDNVEQMLVNHLHDLDIPVCCGFTSDTDCFSLVIGSLCSLDVTKEGSLLTFNMEGGKEAYHIAAPDETLFK